MCVGLARQQMGRAMSDWSGPVHPHGLGWTCREGRRGWRAQGNVLLSWVPWSSHAQELSRGRLGALAVHGPDIHSSLFFSPDRSCLSLGTLSTHFVSKNLGALSKSVKKDFLFAQNQHTPRAFSMAPRAPRVVHESVYPGRAISPFSEQRRKWAYRNHHRGTAQDISFQSTWNTQTIWVYKCRHTQNDTEAVLTGPAEHRHVWFVVAQRMGKAPFPCQISLGQRNGKGGTPLCVWVWHCGCEQMQQSQNPRMVWGWEGP